ncbi:NAD(P)-dependent oxidoreductase [Micromonospora sp. KC207]|uniref:NAD(P)-dependent oxidoreductase n=1 Tax=Micromonospora sp. KC207 TaxID=2530377 RepID=UPI001404F920|nr:NAD(P)-dependent oxidoreductase [Micromonospora sp. KC207]
MSELTPGVPMRILVSRAGFPHVPTMLAEALPEVVVTQCTVAELTAAVRDADVLVPLLAPVTGQVLANGQRLRLVQQWGSGLDRVDLEAARELGVPVSAVDTSATGSAAAVAEWCMMAAIALGRNVPTVSATFPAGSAWGSPLGATLHGSAALVIGMGAVGRALCPLLQVLGARVMAVSASYRGELPGVDGHGYDDLVESVGQADWVFICLRRPMQPPILGERELRSMKPGAFLVNAARGHLVDEGALEHALRTGHLGGAALDVFRHEPMTGAESLLTAPNLLASPHVAGVVDAVERRVAALVRANIRRVGRHQAVWT